MDLKKLKGVEFLITTLRAKLRIGNEDEYGFFYSGKDEENEKIKELLYNAIDLKNEFLDKIKHLEPITQSILIDKYINNLSIKEVCIKHNVGRTAVYNKLQSIKEYEIEQKRTNADATKHFHCDTIRM